MSTPDPRHEPLPPQRDEFGIYGVGVITLVWVVAVVGTIAMRIATGDSMWDRWIGVSVVGLVAGVLGSWFLVSRRARNVRGRARHS